MASQWSRHWLEAALFLVALALRLAHLIDSRHSPYFHTLVLDAEEYQALARSLLAGQWAHAARGTYVHGPLYPLLWAMVEGAGGGLLALRLLQAVLGSASCVLLFAIARRLFPAPVPLLSGLLAACYWPLIVYGGELLSETLVVFLELALVAHLLRHAAPPSATAAFGAGGLLGLLTDTRANALLLAPVVMWWLCLGRAVRACRALGLALLAGLGLVVAPFLVRNYLTQETPLPFQGAWSFYLGANPAADGTPYARQGLDWQRLELLGYRAGSEATPAQRGGVYLTEGLRYIRDQPAAYLHLLYRKLRLFWHAFEVPASVDLRFYEAHSRLRGWLLADFGAVAPLALLGMALTRRRWRECGLLYGGVLAFLVSGLSFTVCDRYRLPAVPFLIVFAAAALVAGWRAVAARDGPRAGRMAVILGAAVALVHTGVDARQVDHLRSSWLQGEVLMRTGDYAGAEVAYLAALREDSGDADVVNSLGAARERLGREVEAEAAYRRALALAPDHSRARLNLGRLLRRTGRLQQAEAAFLEALAVDPRPAIQYEGRLDLGYVYLDGADTARARRAFGLALEAQDRAQGHYALAQVCHAEGALDEELRHLRRAVEVDPGFAAAWRNLGALDLQRGDYAAAERALRRAVSLEPDAAAAHHNLAALFARTGRPDLARAAFATAARLEAKAPAAQ